MKKRNSTAKISTRRRRRTVAWLSGATTAVCAMLYWEQTALLYVMSTLAMCTLLLVVAFSKLEYTDQPLSDLTSEEAVTDGLANTRGVTSEQKAAA